MPIQSVQQAHDALMASMPSGAAHDSCPLCAPGHDREQEVAHVAETTAPAPAGNVYSEAQHFSLLKSAVENETASLTAEKSEFEARLSTLESEKAALATELSESKTRIDVLESDKVTAEAAAETAKTELADFKALLERKKIIEEKKSARKDRVKTANANLTDDYFTNERITRWAEMSDEAFDGLVGEMTEFAAAAAEKTVEKTDESVEKKTEKTTTDAARESAAFTGGEDPSTTDSGISPLAEFLAARRNKTA